MTPRLSESAWQRRVTDLASLRGWQFAHFRPARTERGWRTPVSGSLGAGFPDLVLVRGDRLVFAELKRDGAKPSVVQEGVLGVLRGVESERVMVRVWRPVDWPDVLEVLA